MQGITDNYQFQLRARISNLLASNKNPIEFHNNTLISTLNTPVPDSSLIVPSGQPTNMDIIESNITNVPIDITTKSSSQPTQNINVLDLKIANFALLATLILLIGGTIYYWTTITTSSKSNNL